jgi:hypothetical protein
MKNNLQRGEGEIGSIIIIVLLIWGGIQVWNWIFPSYSDSSYSSSPYSFHGGISDCTEPENPYDYGSGHYAGFEWGENGNYCSGNSDSFVEGCEEYYSQEEAYDDCINN